MVFQGRRKPEGSEPNKPDDVSRAIVRSVEAQRVLPEDVNARDAIASVICVLMGRLSGDEAQNLVDALPPGFKSMLNRCAAHDGKPEESNYRDFIMEISDHMQLQDATLGDRIARAVFSAVKGQLNRREIGDVNSQMPRDLQDLWRSVA